MALRSGDFKGLANNSGRLGACHWLFRLEGTPSGNPATHISRCQFSNKRACPVVLIERQKSSSLGKRGHLGAIKGAIAPILCSMPLKQIFSTASD